MRIEQSPTYNKAGLLDVASKLGILRQETVTWMDHVDAVLNGNLDNLITSQVCADWRILATLANDISFIGLLPVHGESVLITEDCDCLQGKFVGLEGHMLAVRPLISNFSSIGVTYGSENLHAQSRLAINSPSHIYSWATHTRIAVQR